MVYFQEQIFSKKKKKKSREKTIFNTGSAYIKGAL